MHLILRLLLISPFLAISAEHVTITYHFWEKDAKIAEKAEFYTRFVANSNRYWTSNVVFIQHDEKVDKIQVSSEDWKTANVEEIVAGNLDHFFARIFQKFAVKLYNNLILNTKPVFDPQVFEKSRHAYANYEATSDYYFWNTISSAAQNNYTFALLIKRNTFEHWEGVLNFVAAVKRANIAGFIVDCDQHSSVCATQSEMVQPVLLAYQNEKTYKIYDGLFRADNIHDWMLTMNRPIVTKLTEEQVPYWRSGIIPGFSNVQDTVTIFFTHTKKSQIYRNFMSYATIMHGNYHLGVLVDKGVEQWAHHPALVTLKPYDEYVKATTLYEDLTFDRMALFLEDGVHPSCHTLSSSNDFIYATSTRHALVIFYDPLNAKNLTTFKKMASQEQTNQDRLFQSAAITGFDLFGMYLMNALNVHSAKYVILLRKEKGLCVFMRDIDNRGYEEFVKWMESLVKVPCHELVEEYKLPISRLNLIERYEDVADLESELTTVEVTHHEL